MNAFADIVLLFVALALPVMVFLLFRPRSTFGRLAAAIIAVAVGWSLNVAYVVASEAIAAQVSEPSGNDNLAIAVTYGWACPLVFVLLTWAGWRFATRRAR